MVSDKQYVQEANSKHNGGLKKTLRAMRKELRRRRQVKKEFKIVLKQLKSRAKTFSKTFKAKKKQRSLMVKVNIQHGKTFQNLVKVSNRYCKNPDNTEIGVLRAILSNTKVRKQLFKDIRTEIRGRKRIIDLQKKTMKNHKKTMRELRKNTVKVK